MSPRTLLRRFVLIVGAVAIVAGVASTNDFVATTVRTIVRNLLQALWR